MRKYKIIRFSATAFVLLLSIITLIFAPIFSALSYAWFADRQLTPNNAEVMPGFYAGGEGTEEHPYLITRPIHLYNLAWLQQSGKYNTPAEGQTTLTQTYFELAEDLDMTGLTLPPIGTADYPFIGVFSSTEGEKYTISNLTVSNVIDNGEIIKRPHGVNEIGGAEIVGMFGIIGQYNGKPADATYSSIVPRVENFFLENTTIRTQTEKSLVGLIAGYVNGKVHEVGVAGGSLVSGTNNSTGLYGDDAISLYTLIGDRDVDVGWEGIGRPGEEGGGSIKVDVNDTATYNAINTGNGTFAAIPGSKKDHAFTTGTMSLESGNRIRQGVYYFNTLVTTSANLTTVGTRGTTVTGQFVSMNPAQYAEGWLHQNVNQNFTYNADLEVALDRLIDNETPFTLSMGNTPSLNTMRTVTLSTGAPLDIPDNGVWFKPVSPGHCLISFFLSDKGGSAKYKSVYRYRRDKESGAIVANSWQETRFDISSLKNQSLAIFEYEITQSDLDAGYEYVVGTTAGTGSEVRFYFLALAGASNTGGNEVSDTSRELFNVNFIDNIPYTYNGGVIAGPGMTVTTFYVTLLAKNKTEPKTISFLRESMEAQAFVSNESEIADAFKYLKYTHTIPIQTG